MEVADLFATLGLKPKENEWKHGHELIEGIKKGVEIFAGVEAVKQIGEMVKSTGEAAIAALRLGQKVGISTEAVQELGYAAKVSGVNAEQLQHGFQRLALGLAEAKKSGTGPLVDGLTALGISFSEVKNQTPDEMLQTLADRFADMPDGAKKTAAAMQIFGKAGADLIPLLNRGGDGIKELRKEAEDLGLVMSKDTAEAFEKLEESSAKIGGTLTGLKNTAVVALLPVIQKMADELFAWVQANREIIASTIKGVVEGLIVVVKVLASAFGVLVDIVQFFIEHSELGKAVLIALGAVITAVAAEAAAAWIIGFAPIVAVVAAIAGIILIFHNLMKAIVDGKGVFADVGRYIADKFKAMGRGIVDAFKAVGRFFESIASAIKGAFVAVIDWITNKIEWAWKQVKKIGHALAHPGDVVSDAVNYFTGGDNASGPVTSPSQVPSRVISGSGSASNSPVTYVDARADITIQANGTDPQGVVDIANEQIKKHHEKTWRDADIATGGKDEVP